ncbi:11958_t:CDS:1, partial [Gigaspora rosea]
FFDTIIDKISPSISIKVGDFEQIKSIEISQSITQPINASQASPDYNIIELTNELGKKIHYLLVLINYDLATHIMIEMHLKLL